MIHSGADGHDDQIAEHSSHPPTSPHQNITTEPVPSQSPAPSPRFEGFELSQSAPSPIASEPLPDTDDPPNEEQDTTPIKGENDTQSALPSTCPPNVDDHNLQDTGSTDQLRTISSPGSVVSMGSYHKLMDFFLSQPSPRPKSEKKSSPAGPASDAASPTVPNPFYEIDKAYEERRQRTRPRVERDRSFDKASRESSPKESKRDISPSPSTRSKKRKAPSPVQEPIIEEQETSQVSAIPDSIRPAAREPSPPASQMPESGLIDLTQSSPPVSPGGSDEDFAKTHRLPRGSGWVQKSNPPRRQTRQSSASSRLRTQDLSVSPPRKRRGRPSKS